MKKICALVLTTAMLLSFASCGRKDTTKDTKTTEANQTQTSESTTTVALASKQTIVDISDADVEEYVSAVKLVIKSGILYVVVYDGSVYKTAIEADSIIVDRPEFGKGTVSTAEIRKDNQTVMFFSRSQVEDSNMTQKEVEEKFGPVIKVEVSPDSEKLT